jgi:hydrogenase maturation protein HypF
MAEHAVDETVAIVCDGFGLGYDGEAWGGEILVCHGDEVRRAAHLEKQPMLGGDLATRYPARMVAGILRDEPTIGDWLKANSSNLPHGEEEVAILLQQLEKGDFIWTSSCGRVLDSIAAVLGICFERTYEGEPAMKLESFSRGGADGLNVEPEMEGEVIRTTNMVRMIYDQREKIARANLAFAAHSYLARALADAAVGIAEQEAIMTVGFSGGVALNEVISVMIRDAISDAGLRFVSNVAVPPGDGGVSFGQAYLASLQ